MPIFRKLVLRWTALFLPVLALSSTVLAKGVSPYLPEKLSPALENEVERLVVLAGIPNLTKPYSIATVVRYTEEIRETYPGLYSRLNLLLKPYTRRLGVTHAKVGVAYSEENHPIPNSRGNDTDSIGSLSFRGQWQMADWFGLYAGAHLSQYSEEGLSEEHQQASGSIVSLGVDWAQLDVGYRDLWLSPFQGSAQLFSTHAQSVPSLTLSNNLPISFFGARWNYQAFVAEISRQPVEFENGEVSTKDKPLVAGLHLSVQPTPWWSLGASRVFQFAGGERPLNFKTLVRAFFDPRGADNDAEVDAESGNQIASVVSKINFDGRLPFSFALELAGEDTSNNKDYQLGNTALTAGWYFPYFFSDDLSFAYEYSDWQDGWYINNVYKEGYVNEGYVLGHWAMQIQREQGTAVEGRAHYFKAQYQLFNDHIIAAEIRLAKHENTAGIDYSDASEVVLDYILPLGSHILTLGTYFGRDALDNDFSQLSVSVEW